MIPDEIAPLDDALLAELLAIDAKLAAGGDPLLNQGSETLNTIGWATAGYIGVLRRLGHRRASAASDPDATRDATSPLRFGRFEIIETLGQGGFGIVYRALDPTLGREVALKVPRPEVLITPEVRRRFLREARAAGGLDHPNIVAVHEVGEAGPICYIASAYCVGPTLSAWLKSRTEPVPPRLAAQLVVPLSDAVQHAHDRGVLHRDIKPSNVILAGGRIPGTEGSAASLVPRLTDFGLARIAEETGDETRTGVPLGSPPYMAPEQAAGRSRDIGPATDVYALGATLYEILTGRAPFRGETATETLRLVLEAEPVAPRILRPGLPRDLETICLKCLEKDQARRYASARALRQDLDRYLNDQPIHARPISMRERVGKWARRRPGHAAAILLAAMLGIALVGGIVYRNVLLQNHAVHLEHEVARADANARLARRHLEAFQLRQAREALDARQVERAQDILRTIEADRESSGEARKPGDLGFAWRYLMRLARQDLVVLSDRQAERVNHVALSPDGRTLATGDEDGTIRLRDPETGRLRATLSGHQLPVGLLVFAPDGTHLVSRGTRDQPSPRRDEVLLWDLVSTRLQARVEGLAGRLVEDLKFGVGSRHVWETSHIDGDRMQLGLWDIATDPVHPRLQWRKPSALVEVPLTGDGRVVALEETGRRFVVHDLSTGTDLGRIGPIDHDCEFAAPSPDGRLLALGRGSSRKISLWDVAVGRENAHFDDSHPGLQSFRFSPDSRYLVLRYAHGVIAIRDLVTGAVPMVTPAVTEPHPMADFAFSPDGRFLTTSVSELGKPQPTMVWQLDPWRRVATYPGVPGGWALFTQDGRSLIVDVNQAAIRWNYATPAQPAQPAGHADEAWSLAFSPDGSVLASGSDDTDEPKTIKLWDVATGRMVRGWSAGVGTVSALAFDPAGRVLVSGHLGKPGDVRLWDATTGQRLADLAGHDDSVRALAFSPDGATLATAGSDRTVRLWNVAERRCLHILTGHDDTVRHLSFSPDGARLATAANDRAIRIWDVAPGRLGSSLPWIDKLSAVAFAPGGRSLAAADEKGRITMWDLATATRVQTINTEDNELRCLGFSPDREILAAAGKSRTIRLWDPVTGQELLSLDGHKAQINALAFSPDGSALASCSHDGAVRLWRARPADRLTEQ